MKNVFKRKKTFLLCDMIYISEKNQLVKQDSFSRKTKRKLQLI